MLNLIWWWDCCRQGSAPAARAGGQRGNEVDLVADCLHAVVCSLARLLVEEGHASLQALQGEPVFRARLA